MVIDASALLAFLLAEVGADMVKPLLPGSLLCAINLAEIVSVYSKRGVSRADIESLLSPVPVRIVPVDLDLSYEAGMLRRITVQHGLSLGDRYCLALAKREGLPALTGERRWPAIAEAVGVEVVLFR